MDWTKFLEAGPTAMLSAVLFLVALGGYNFFKGRRWKTPNGERRTPVNIDCPNKLPGLQPALNGLTTALEQHNDAAADHAAATRSFAPIAQRIDSGVDRLLEQVKPGSRTTQVREESRDKLFELAAEQKVNTGLMRELVDLVRAGNGNP